MNWFTFQLFIFLHITLVFQQSSITAYRIPILPLLIYVLEYTVYTFSSQAWWKLLIAYSINTSTLVVRIEGNKNSDSVSSRSACCYILYIWMDILVSCRLIYALKILYILCCFFTQVFMSFQNLWSNLINLFLFSSVS